MVLSTLADIIYNLYLLIYYVLKTCAFIGYLLIDIVHHVSWLIKNAYDFCTVVYEDNRYFIQDLKSVVVGTADFFINNIATAYSASRSICENLSKTVAALLNCSNFIVTTAKQGLVLIGLCIICEDNERSVAFVPCGHICACKVCSIHLCYHNPVCPLCRSYIQQKLEIYL
uniref:Uncharacterized protein n=1 Tax=Anopheles atroparvus TaxID=41427 RepID=A0A182IVG3_ANOAO